MKKGRPIFLVLFLVTTLLGISPSYAVDKFTAPIGGYISSSGLTWGPVITQDANTSSELFPSAYPPNTPRVYVMMSFDLAKICCSGLPRKGFPASCPFGADGSRVATRDEWIAVSEELGYQGPGSYSIKTNGGNDLPPGYKPSRMPDLLSTGFAWSSTPYVPGDRTTRCQHVDDFPDFEPGRHSAWYFYSPHACVDVKGMDDFAGATVRCVH